MESLSEYCLVVTKVALHTELSVGDRFEFTKSGLKGEEDKGDDVLIGPGEACQIKLHPDDDTVFSKVQAAISLAEFCSIRCKSPTVPTRIRLVPGNKYILSKDDYILFGYNIGFRVDEVLTENLPVNNSENVVNFRIHNLDTIIPAPQKKGKKLKITWVHAFPELKDTQQVFEDKECFTIGRTKSSDVCLLNPENPDDCEISRIHAQISYSNTIGWYIGEDPHNPSLNGTFFCIKTYSAKGKKDSFPLILQPDWEIYCGDTAFQVISYFLL
jgi:hypothetical protein